MKKFILNLFEKREKGYYFLLFLVFSLIVTSQILMRKGGMMEYFSAIETFEGEFITDEKMFNKTELVLELKGEIPQITPEIYLNGERVGFFDQMNKTIIAETDSVVEIFCEEDLPGMCVNVKWNHKEIVNYVKAYPVKLKKGYNIVARVSFL